MNGNASADRSRSGASRATTSRDRGPTTAIVAHCSVTEVQCTSSSGHSVCSHSSSQSRTPGGAAGRGGHEVAVVVEAQGHAVVEDHAVGLAHHAVAGRAGLELLEGVGVDPVEELARVRAPDLDLAEGGGVHERHPLPGRPALARHGRVHVLTGLRVVPGALPLPDVLELRAVRHVPAVDGRGPLRVEQLAALTPGQGGEGDRRVRRPVGRGADLSERDRRGPRRSPRSR